MEEYPCLIGLFQFIVFIFTYHIFNDFFMPRIVLIFILVINAHFLGAQVITTVAGTGVSGFSGDGGPAITARLNNPHGTAVDGAGNIFIADNLNSRVRQVKTTGFILTNTGTGVGVFAGDGGYSYLANINQPFDITVGGDGDLFISDTWNNRIRKVDAMGIITTIAGTGVSGYSGDGGQATAAKLSKPSGIALDNAGNLCFADQYNHRVRKINLLTGIITTVAGTGFTGSGGDGGQATNATLHFPNFIYIDVAGNLYISDNSSHRIRKVNSSGIIGPYAGSGTPGFAGDGGPASTASLQFPAGMTMDAHGNAYIADHMNHRIRKINTAGIISTIAGTGVAGYSGDGGMATAAQLQRPTDVDVDFAGNVIVCDYYNQRIRKINLNTVPEFTIGYSTVISGCAAVAMPLDTTLSIIDINIGELETWTVLTSPSNGVLTGFPFSAFSTGGVVIPSGVSYSSFSGYLGADSFRIRVSDGANADTLLIYVSIDTADYPSHITGIDTLCPGDIDTLSSSVLGGVWSVTNTTIGTISASGIFSALTSGIDTVIYTVVNACGESYAYFPLFVRPSASCLTDISGSILPDISISLFPHPVQGTFIIKVTGISTPVKCAIHHITGSLVATYEMPASGKLLVSNRLSSGLYVLTAYTEGRTYRQQFVVLTDY